MVTLTSELLDPTIKFLQLGKHTENASTKLKGKDDVRKVPFLS